MTALTAVSLFAGVGGFDLACQRAGITVTAAVEIDPACRRVLARRFPATTLFADIQEVTGDQLRAAGFDPSRGLLTAGFPCQDISLAGRRAGLAGARSGLFWHIMRLADELSPRWLVLENVPGLLSSVCPCPGQGACMANGRADQCGEWRGDHGTRRWFPGAAHKITGGACPGGCIPAHGGAMGTVLGALGQRGYGFAYRVLDAQFFGVPQRRQRVFIAGCLGDRAAPVQVLLEPESGGRDHPPGAQPGARVAGAVAASAGSGGLGGAGQSASAITSRLAETVASTLQGGGRRGYRVDAEAAAGGHLVTLPIAVRGRHGGSRIEAGHPGEPAFTLRTPAGGSSYPMIAHTITAREGNGPDSGSTTGFILTRTLTAEGADASEDGTGRGTPLVPVFAPLTAGSAASPGVNPPGRRVEDDTNLVAVPIQDGRPIAKAQHGAGIGRPAGPSFTLDTTGHQSVATPAAVRRLTPRECERLQGFPDDWTAGQSDAARYRQLGNAVAVPVAAWITRRIARSPAEQQDGAA